MALVNPFIFQVVGYHNSGKTTMVSQLIKLLKAEGLKVVSIKHHGHGNKPSVVEKKDSSVHLDSGAAAVIVEGGGRLLLQAENQSWTVEEEIELVRFFNPDVILIEGFKKEAYPKLLLVRDKEDLELLTALSNIKVVVSWNMSEEWQPFKEGQTWIPYFYIHSDTAANWTVKFIKNQLTE